MRRFPGSSPLFGRSASLGGPDLNLKRYILIALTGLTLMAVVLRDYHERIRAAQKQAREENAAQAHDIALRVERVFERIYGGVRTMARLPGVRSIDRYAKTFEGDARTTVQELYNSLASDVAMSEVYIVPVDLDPDQIDPVTGEPQAPIITFDELILGRHADSDLPHETAEAEEIEIHEYRLMKEQLAWFRAHVPTESDISGLQLPALSGREVITCDNSRFSPSKPEDADRSGIVYSVPFYGPDGMLKGCVSAVFLSSVLHDLLPDANTAIRNVATGQTITGPGLGAASANPDLVAQGIADPELPACSVSTLRFPDHSTSWVLWHAMSPGDFKARADVRAAQFAVIAWAIGDAALCAFLMMATHFYARAATVAETHKRELELLVAERTMQFERSEARARTIIETAMDAVVTLDEHGRVTDWNGMAELIFGHTAQEATGIETTRFLQCEPGKPASLEAVLGAADASDDARACLIGVRRSGDHFPAELSVSSLNLHGRPLYGLFIRDVTQRRRAEEELKRASIAAESASRAKSEFLANMSHEIRTPMTAILGFADILHDHGHDEEIRREHLATIRRNGEHLLSIINDILDLSKIEAGHMTFESLRVSTSALVDELVTLLRPRAESKGLTFSVETAPGTPPSLVTDPTRLKQVLVNLVGNALKFTEQGGVTVHIRPAPHDPAVVCFEVQDTGIGMSPEQVSRIFRPFSQADASMTRRFGGTGLGLSISHKLAERLGGGVSVRSELGRGSTFTVTVTGASWEAVEHLRASAPEPVISSHAALDGIRILLAEDGPDNQRLISFMLRKAGASVQIVDNGEAALASAPGAGVHVILMDMQMPIMDGYTATSSLRSAGYTRPIIALTAHAMAGERERCIAAGCDEYLTKPISREQLVQTILRMVRDHNPART